MARVIRSAGELQTNLAVTGVSKFPATSTVSCGSGCLRNKNENFTSRMQVGKCLDDRTLAETDRKKKFI